MESLKNILFEALAPLWLLLTPFVSAIVFGALFISLMVSLKNGFHKDGVMFKIVLLATILLGGYSAFNAYDYVRYKKYGLAISPINQGLYYLFMHPSDLYKPYSRTPLTYSKKEYSVRYKNKYGGPQDINLNLVNNTPKEFDYNNPDRIDLVFHCDVHCEASGFKTESSKSFTKYFLLPGTNLLTICSYEIKSPKELELPYIAKIKISGNLKKFLEMYPDSYLSVRNGSSK